MNTVLHTELEATILEKKQSYKAITAILGLLVLSAYLNFCTIMLFLIWCIKYYVRISCLHLTKVIFISLNNAFSKEALPAMSLGYNSKW